MNKESYITTEELLKQRKCPQCGSDTFVNRAVAHLDEDGNPWFFPLCCTVRECNTGQIGNIKWIKITWDMLKKLEKKNVLKQYSKDNKSVMVFTKEITDVEK